MIKIPLNLVTKEGKKLPFDLMIHKLRWEYVKVDKAATTQQCMKCKMYGKRGGCPPNSPEFNKVYGNRFEHIYLIGFYVPLQEWMSEKVKNLPHVSHQFLYGSGFVEAIIKSHEKHVVRILRDIHPGSKVLPTSYCTVCQKCTVNDSGGCKNPKDRMFSPESLGVLVSDTLEYSGLSGLTWFQYGDKNAILPETIKKIMLFMCDDKLNLELLLDNILSIKNIEERII